MKCVVTKEDMVTCRHCNEDDYIVIDDTPEIEYEVLLPAFRSLYKGVCTIDARHRIKVQDLVAKVQRSDNPALIVTGVACKTCTQILPKGKR